MLCPTTTRCGCTVECMLCSGATAGSSRCWRRRRLRHASQPDKSWNTQWRIVLHHGSPRGGQGRLWVVDDICHPSLQRWRHFVCKRLTLTDCLMNCIIAAIYQCLSSVCCNWNVMHFCSTLFRVDTEVENVEKSGIRKWSLVRDNVFLSVVCYHVYCEGDKISTTCSRSTWGIQ